MAWICFAVERVIRQNPYTRDKRINGALKGRRAANNPGGFQYYPLARPRGPAPIRCTSVLDKPDSYIVTFM